MDCEIRSRALGQGVCLKSMSRSITMQDFTLTAIIDAEKTKLLRNFDVKINKVNGPSIIGQWHWVKVRACRVCQGQFLCKVSHLWKSLMQRNCLKSMSRTITMQDFTLTAIIDAEKTKLLRNFDVKINKLNGP